MSVRYHTPRSWVVFDGQSLNLTGNFPSQVMAPYNPSQGMRGRIVAIGGMAWENLEVTAPSRTDLFARVGLVNFCLLNGCQTALTLGQSASDLRTSTAAYAAARKAAGFDYVIVTTVPAAGPTYFSAAEDLERQAFNAALLATGVSSGDFDGVADMATALDAVADPNGSDPTYYADLVHWTIAGAGVGAGAVHPILEPFLP